jgi:type I restriction enzyme M protein
MNNITNDIVAKLWNLCNVLKDDGVTYHQYVTELTFLLFLKMAEETGSENQIPEGYRWNNLLEQPSLERLETYKITLIHLSNHGSSIVKEIFNNATSFIKKPSTLSILIEGVNKIDWYNAGREDLGDVYEGLLEKNANEKKSGAGQYFTTRSLIDSMVAVMQPNLEDVIQDPAAGTGGFLIAANHYIRQQNDIASWTDTQKEKYQKATFFGMEHVQDTHRMALMNLFLHGIDSDAEAGGIQYGDTLSPQGQLLPKATLMLSNPPFGSKKGGGLPDRVDLPFPTSNKQLCFLQHIYLGLESGGRAAVILPDNVLFESNIGRQVRLDLLEKCNLHTILRLPTGIFYAHGVKTCVLFFTRGKSDKANTQETWVYDMRAATPQYGKRNQLTRSHFADFELAFGNDPYGKKKSLSTRKDTGENGRFRRFSRDWIANNNDNLDISWLKDEMSRELLEPAMFAQLIMEDLEGALNDLRGIMSDLGEEIE